MFIKSLAAGAALFMVLVAAPVEARPHAHGNAAGMSDRNDGDWVSVALSQHGDASTSETREKRTSRHRRVREASEGDGDTSSYTGHHGGLGPRPSQWCGWYMRSRHGGGPEYNLAANWRHYGSPASPQVGAIVVWPHHVGEIVGQAANGAWIVLSGNWSGRVHSGPRSIAGTTVRI